MLMASDDNIETITMAFKAGIENNVEAPTIA
jgi:hypothetical protein